MIVLSHCKAPQVASGEVEHCHFELAEANTDALHSKFSALCDMQPLRAVNWEQSFAHRGLNVKDYERTADASQFIFRRRGKAAKSEQVSFFWRDDDPHATLQGDVITYVKNAPVLKASRINVWSFKILPFPTSLLKKLLSRGFLVDQASVEQLFTALPRNMQDLDTFRERILTDWDRKMSFLSIEVSSLK
jgi:hypothetical protein